MALSAFKVDPLLCTCPAYSIGRGALRACRRFQRLYGIAERSLSHHVGHVVGVPIGYRPRTGGV